MYGGTISCNVAKNGGGVSVSRNVDKSSSEFHMFGGNIIKNSANSNWSSYGNGGGVYVSWTAMCFLKGGSIRENSASVSGGGIYGSAFARNNANGNGGAAGIYVLGSATVTENKADGKNNNVYLRSHTADNGFDMQCETGYSWFTQRCHWCINKRDSNDRKSGDHRDRSRYQC